MAIQILMPALSPTMTEGKIAKWVKKEGDTVASGDVLAEIETDKATMEVEAVDEGGLGKILVAEGTEGVAVNTPIALIVEEGEEVSAAEAAAALPAAGPPPPSDAKPAPEAEPPAASPAPAHAHGSTQPQPWRPPGLTLNRVLCSGPQRPGRPAHVATQSLHAPPC